MIVSVAKAEPRVEAKGFGRSGEQSVSANLYVCTDLDVGVTEGYKRSARPWERVCNVLL